MTPPCPLPPTPGLPVPCVGTQFILVVGALAPHAAPLQYAGGAMVLVPGTRIPEVGTTFASCFWLVPLPPPPPPPRAYASVANAKSSAMAIPAPKCASFEFVDMTITLVGTSCLDLVRSLSTSVRCRQGWLQQGGNALICLVQHQCAAGAVAGRGKSRRHVIAQQRDIGAVGSSRYGQRAAR